MSDFFMDTYRRTGLVLREGHGATVTSAEGRDYIDFTAGIGVNSLGHGHPGLVAAIAEQAGRLIHVSNYYQSEPALEAARLVCAAAGMDRVFLCNSGAEALEGAIKIARKRGNALPRPRSGIVTLLSSFHGRTITDLAATGQEKLHRHFGPFPAGFRHVAPNNLAALDAALDDTICAFIYEPIQGEGGVLPLDHDYLRGAARLCRERGILLVADEVQSGVGRTGSFLASSLAGVGPDVVALAKGLAGGLPIGAVLARGEAASVLGPGDHGSTFGGNPLAAAAACFVLTTLAGPGFLREVAAKGEAMMERIRGWESPIVKDVRGAGLMMGLVTKIPPDEVKHAALDRGLLVLTAGEDVVRLLPPLVITEGEIGEGLGLLRASLESLA